MQSCNKSDNAGVYLNPPLTFSPQIISCGCFVQFKKTFLFLQKAKGQWSEFLWGMPCGKMEKNENIFAAMQREMFEETTINLMQTDFHFVKKLYIIQKEGRHNLHHVFYYNCKEKPSVGLSDEHIHYQWLTQEELINEDLIPFQYEVFLQAIPALTQNPLNRN